MTDACWRRVSTKIPLLTELRPMNPTTELKKRKKAWKQSAPRYPHGTLAEYAHTVTSGSEAAVTDKDLKL